MQLTGVISNAMKTATLKDAMKLEVRNSIIHFLASSEVGLNGADIADIMSVDKSTISRILRMQEPVGGRYIKILTTIINDKTYDRQKATVAV
jgi:predicted transcriptional regulator